MNELPADKVTELQGKLASLGGQGHKESAPLPTELPNFDDYAIEPQLLPWYQRSRWHMVDGEPKLVYRRMCTEIVEAPQSKIVNAIDDMENGPEAWLLMSVFPVSKRPNKADGAGKICAVFRRAENVVLPDLEMSVKNSVAPEQEEAWAEQRAKDWEANESSYPNDGRDGAQIIADAGMNEMGK